MQAPPAQACCYATGAPDAEAVDNRETGGRGGRGGRGRRGGRGGRGGRFGGDGGGPYSGGRGLAHRQHTPHKHSVLTDVFQSGSLEALESVIVRSAASFDEDHVAAAIARLVALTGEDVGMRGGVLGGAAAPPAIAAGGAGARQEAVGRAQRLLAGLCAALSR